MKLSILTQLEYYLPETTDVLLQLEAAMIPEQPVEFAHIDLPPAEHFARLPGHDEIGDRIWLRLQGPLTVRYEGRVSVERMTSDIESLRKMPPHMLPAETIEYLMPSRYCASDEFQALAEADFGKYQGGERIMAMRDWIEREIRYAPGSSNAATDALQTYVSRSGVCRDFAHLLICMSGIDTQTDM